MSPKTIHLSQPPEFLEGEVFLPGSKSESNRALILKAQARGNLEIRNLSEAEDTRCLDFLLDKVHRSSISQGPLVLDVGPAGTAMRFLTAYLSIQEGKFILTGSERMLERPIKILVESLQKLGADIEYLGKEGYPPIQIQGKKWDGNFIQIPANISSQYISAILLIAPSCTKGLEIEMIGELTSAPYVEMTLEMMKSLGIEIQYQERGWFIPHQEISSGFLDIEPDWSAASYWYSLACLSPNFKLSLPGLRKESLQADRNIVSIMQPFGVSTEFQSKGIQLIPVPKGKISEVLDFKKCPDIAQTLVALVAGLGLEMEFTGLETLKIKETDRVEALKVELSKIGVDIVSEGGKARIIKLKTKFPNSVSFKTYHDHRMAMALTPLVFKIPQIEIENKSVVNKSYPGFWKDLEKTGFTLKD